MRLQTKTTSKTIAKTATLPRHLKKPRRGKRVKTHLKVTRQPLPTAFRILRGSIAHLFRHWKPFLGITIVYLVLTLALVKGFGVTNNVSSLKSSLQHTFHGKIAVLTTGVTVFGVLLSSTGSATSSVSGAYQTILLLTVSLALIWALRQTYTTDDYRVTARDAFYKGLFPLVPFLLVLLVIGLQLIPLVLAGTIYNLVFGNGLAVHWYEQYAWGGGMVLLVSWSIYMVSSSIFALYIVTLPDVTPIQALRSARELVRYRRATVFFKVVFLPLALIILTAIIIVPLIFVFTKGVAWTFLVLSMFALAVAHSYLYSLYRSLI